MYLLLSRHIQNNIFTYIICMCLCLKLFIFEGLVMLTYSKVILVWCFTLNKFYFPLHNVSFSFIFIIYLFRGLSPMKFTRFNKTKTKWLLHTYYPAWTFLLLHMYSCNKKICNTICTVVTKESAVQYQYNNING